MRIRIRKRSSWLSGRGHVPPCSPGFWVAIASKRSAKDSIVRGPTLCLATRPLSLLSRLMGLALAVDVGGTKLAAGLVTDEGELVTSAAAPTPANDDAESIFAVVLALVDAVGGDGELAMCGVGCGGPMTAGGEEVSPLNIPGWRRFPLRERLAQLTGVPTFVDNDAKALALGEGWRGAAVGERDFLAMVVSTGVGGGLVVDGRLLDGAQGNAGH